MPTSNEQVRSERQSHETNTMTRRFRGGAMYQNIQEWSSACEKSPSMSRVDRFRCSALNFEREYCIHLVYCDFNH